MPERLSLLRGHAVPVPDGVLQAVGHQASVPLLPAGHGAALPAVLGPAAAARQHRPAPLPGRCRRRRSCGSQSLRRHSQPRAWRQGRQQAQCKGRREGRQDARRLRLQGGQGRQGQGGGSRAGGGSGACCSQRARAWPGRRGQEGAGAEQGRRGAASQGLLRRQGPRTAHQVRWRLWSPHGGGRRPGLGPCALGPFLRGFCSSWRWPQGQAWPATHVCRGCSRPCSSTSALCQRLSAKRLAAALDCCRYPERLPAEASELVARCEAHLAGLERQQLEPHLAAATSELRLQVVPADACCASTWVVH
jgi:hypothetical protein